MSFNKYKTLEEALEFAGSRIPFDLYRILIGQVEEVISSQTEHEMLERKIYKMVEDYSSVTKAPAFSIERVRYKEKMAAA